MVTRLNHNSKTNMCAKKKEQITTKISIFFGKEKEKKLNLAHGEH